MTSEIATVPQQRGAESGMLAQTNADTTNVGDLERLVSLVGGSVLTGYGLRTAPRGLLLSLVGGALIYRGVSGHCTVFQALGISTAEGEAQPVHIEKAVTVNRSPSEVYRFWRDFGNLPSFMRHVQSVQVLDTTHSRWTVQGPAGSKVSWDAEIFLERPDELIAWRSLPDADVANAGTVRFQQAPGGRGTEVKVILEYRPPAGRLGAVAAWLFGKEPRQQMKDDLSRFKQVMEAGEIPTTRGQPAGR